MYCLIYCPLVFNINNHIYCSYSMELMHGQLYDCRLVFADQNNRSDEPEVEFHMALPEYSCYKDLNTDHTLPPINQDRLQDYLAACNDALYPKVPDFYKGRYVSRAILLISIPYLSSLYSHYDLICYIKVCYKTLLNVCFIGCK
jgi:hypothetical protein